MAVSNRKRHEFAAGFERGLPQVLGDENAKTPLDEGFRCRGSRFCSMIVLCSRLHRRSSSQAAVDGCEFALNVPQVRQAGPFGHSI